jgi:xylulokinase
MVPLMTSYIAGLDNGTTSTRAKLYDTSGAVIAEASQAYKCRFPKPGWVDQDINVLHEANLDVLARIVQDSGVDPQDIASLGVSTQRGLHLYVDENDTVLRDGFGISWQDTRHPQQLDLLRREVGNERFYDLTGLPIGAFWPIGKILWVKENEPEVLAGAAKILTTQEYFLRKLGGTEDWFIDWANASLTGLMDIDKLEWSQELLDVIGIGIDQLPTIVPGGERVGQITEEVAARTGLPVGMPVSTGGGDQQCAAIGAGVIEAGLCELTFGTAGNSVAVLAGPINDPNRVITRSMHALREPVWQAEGIQASAGSAYRWFLEHIGYLARYIEPFTQVDPYELINNLAAKSPCGANGLIFHPYLAGSLTPHYDELARGGFIGLTHKHGLPDLARAVLEGVAYEAREIFQAYDAMGHQISEVRLAGGATKSDLWCQIQADVYGRPTTVLREGECAALGAAILGAVGAGVFRDIRHGIDSAVHVKRTFQPDPERHQRYGELGDIFHQAYTALSESGVYAALAKVQAGN